MSSGPQLTIQATNGPTIISNKFTGSNYIHGGWTGVNAYIECYYTDNNGDVIKMSGMALITLGQITFDAGTAEKENMGPASEFPYGENDG